MKIVAISDTHGQHGSVEIPECDVLIHAGDFTGTGNYSQVTNFLDWFEKQPAKHKVFVAGNHDFFFEKPDPCSELMWDMESDYMHYLEDDGITIDGVYFYGSPWTPTFFDWAFMGSENWLERMFSKIPENVDFLITHGPEKGVLDKTREGKSVGSQSLSEALKNLENPPKHHIFGHIHEAHGSGISKNCTTRSHNVSICTRNYSPTQRFTEIEVDE